jgi:hypothetical protein
MLRILFELAAQVLLSKRVDNADTMVFWSSLASVFPFFSLAQAVECGGATLVFCEIPLMIMKTNLDATKLATLTIFSSNSAREIGLTALIDFHGQLVE